MKFTKMHGAGNDYVYINGFTEKIADKKQFAISASDRHFGIGGDGAIFINPSDQADFEMEMYNADGSRSEMCGNGIRCVAKYVYDYGLTNKINISIISGGQIRYLNLTVEDGKVTKVRVNMGTPCLTAKDIPVVSSRETVIEEDIQVGEDTYKMTCVSMGNPHAVIFVDETVSIDLEKIGPLFEMHERFPNRVNTEFIKVVDESNIEMRVWERGSGETLACGTGACASVVACVINGLTQNRVTVKLLGGELEIEYNEAENTVYMTGPASTVFEGEYLWP